MARVMSSRVQASRSVSPPTLPAELFVCPLRRGRYALESVVFCGRCVCSMLGSPTS